MFINGSMKSEFLLNSIYMTSKIILIPNFVVISPLIQENCLNLNIKKLFIEPGRTALLC